MQACYNSSSFDLDILAELEREKSSDLSFSKIVVAVKDAGVGVQAGVVRAVGRVVEEEEDKRR